VSIERLPEPIPEEVPEPPSTPVEQAIPEPTEEPMIQEPMTEEPITGEPITQEPTTPEQPKAVSEEAVHAEVMEEAVEPSLPLATLNKPIKRLLNIGTVQGAFICSRDGLLIQDYCENRRDVEEMSALIAAIHNEAEQSSQFLKAGSVEKFIIEKGDETICVLVTGESLFTVITEPEAKPGLVFVYARKIIDEIREILG
jgi:predicted regulator of Ras-like GTPase activity (Roadblock/LC7/MglB family)